MTDIDQADQTDQLAAFVDAIRAAIGDRVTEEYAPTGGYAWTWSHRGMWALCGGSILEPGVEIIGPAGAWKCPASSLLAADQVLTLLRLADAIPPARTAAAGATYTGLSEPEPPAVKKAAAVLPVPISGVPPVTLPPVNRDAVEMPVPAPWPAGYVVAASRSVGRRYAGDDRRPAPRPAVAGSDLPPRDAGLPVAGRPAEAPTLTELVDAGPDLRDWPSGQYPTHCILPHPHGVEAPPLPRRPQAEKGPGAAYAPQRVDQD